VEELLKESTKESRKRATSGGVSVKEKRASNTIGTMESSVSRQKKRG
jgi:hypothetical protein